MTSRFSPNQKRIADAMRQHPFTARQVKDTTSQTIPEDGTYQVAALHERASKATVKAVLLQDWGIHYCITAANKVSIHHERWEKPLELVFDDGYLVLSPTVGVKAKKRSKKSTVKASVFTSLFRKQLRERFKWVVGDCTMYGMSGQVTKVSPKLPHDYEQYNMRVPTAVRKGTQLLHTI